MTKPIVSVNEIDAKAGLYRVGGRLWKVGSKYKILQFLAGGPYAESCRAAVRGTPRLVVIKMMIGWTRNVSIAEGILREIYVMRRLSHPNILSLVEAFFSPPDENGGTDLYIVSEFPDNGSMNDLQRSLSPTCVKRLMLQLLEGIKYMHSCGVWHRDIKPDNVLLMTPMTVKICCFNHSRFVGEISQNAQQDNVTQSSERQLTSMIGTRSYRAPELIMSDTEYTPAIDIWAAGCIFWQLLKQQSTPSQRTVNYIFEQKSDVYPTPSDQESFLTDKNEMRFKLVNDMFDIIGTPSWNDIQSIPNHKWRRYLKNLPGRPSNLRKTLGKVDDDAIDLLSRMLCFNPTRRCTAEEALVHQYFINIQSKGSIPSMPRVNLLKFDEEIQKSITNGTNMQFLMDLIQEEVHLQQVEAGALEYKKKPNQSFKNQPTTSSNNKRLAATTMSKGPKYM